MSSANGRQDLSALGVQDLSALGIQALVDPGKTPTDEQVRVIEAPRRPLLVVAGAGSGKTETMSMRVLWLVANHEDIAPSSVLGLTFTRKAAGELGDRLRQRLALLAGRVPSLRERLDEDPVSLTYNSFAERIVAEHGMRIGIDPDFTMLTEAGAVDLMTQIVEGWPTDLDEDLSPSAAVGHCLHLAGEVGEHGYTVEEARDALEGFGRDLEQIGATNDTARRTARANARRLAYLGPVEEFQRRKREGGLLDFSDQLVLATRIVRGAPAVRAQVRDEFQAVLLDEFQDTSVIQMELLSLLFHDHAVTAVGDPNQAIYGWRGASASSLERFLDRFQDGPAQPGQTLTLSTAWRNDRNILRAANRVAAPLREHSRAAKSPVLRARPGAGEGRVDVAYTQDYRSALGAVVDFVSAHRARGTQEGKRPTTAVLCRRRSDFPYVDMALREAGVPTQIVGLGGLLDQPSVQDARAALVLADDVEASPWLARLLAGIDLGAADLVALGDWARHLACEEGRDPHRAVLLDAVDNPPEPGWSASSGARGRPAISGEAVRRVRTLGSRLRAVRAGAGRSVVEQVERAVSIMGILDDVVSDPLAAGGRAALDAFVDVAASYEAEVPGASLSSFLAYLDMADERENGLEAPVSEPDPQAVQIMTVHASKGLEWDGVVVFAMDDGVFPSHSKRRTVDWRDGPPTDSGWVRDASALPYPLRGDHMDLPDFDLDVEGEAKPSAAFKKWLEGDYEARLGEHAEREERRLAYVAMTRARSAQLLVGSWMYRTGALPRHPSRYLMEAHAELFGGAAAGGAVPVEEGSASGTDGVPRAARTVPGEDGGGASGTGGSAAPGVGGPLVVPGVGSALVVPRPDEEELGRLALTEAEAAFPEGPGPSRAAVARAAAQVRSEIASMRADADVFDLLAQMEGEPGVADTVALLEEHRVSLEAPVVEIWQDRVPATSVSELLDDPQAFAARVRRPMPAEPSESSALGTVFHAWAERQLHLASPEPAGGDPTAPGDGPVGSLLPADEAGADGGVDASLGGGPQVVEEAALDERSRAKLEVLRENFTEFVATELAGCSPVGIEEPFSVEVGGVSVQGRIDAVFERTGGGGPRFVVIDWKSGRAVDRRTNPAKLRYFITQLRLYRRAWSQRAGVPESAVEARVAFLAGPASFTVEQLEARCGADPGASLDDLVRGALGAEE